MLYNTIIASYRLHTVRGTYLKLRICMLKLLLESCDPAKIAIANIVEDFYYNKFLNTKTFYKIHPISKNRNYPNVINPIAM